MKSLPSLKPVRPHFLLRAGEWLIPLGPKTLVMGIINVTPDSFSKDGLIKGSQNYQTKAWAYAQKLIRDGADVLDIGGESSRPGSAPISAKEERKRVIPLLKRLCNENTLPVSIDTYKPAVAQEALDEGAAIINNIYGTQPNKALLKMIRNYKAAIVLMHMRGRPQSMQKIISYKNAIKEISQELKKTIEICLEIGIKSDKIIVDPGIGFGKTPEHNLEIISQLKAFHVLRQPILIGTSRKSFIGKILGKEVHERLMGTAATVVAGILQGAHIVRIHDVKQLKDAITMTDAIMNRKADD